MDGPLRDVIRMLFMHHTLLIDVFKQVHTDPCPCDTPMEAILYGSTWDIINPLLTTDDVVRTRVAAKKWNIGEKYGALGPLFFDMLKFEQFGVEWSYDAGGNRVSTLRRKHNPIMNGMRVHGLHLLNAVPSPSGPADMTVLRNGFAALAGYPVEGYPVTNMRPYMENATRESPVTEPNDNDNDDEETFSSGNMSPDLGEAWRYGCPRSPSWNDEGRIPIRDPLIPLPLLMQTDSGTKQNLHWTRRWSAWKTASDW